MCEPCEPQLVARLHLYVYISYWLNQHCFCSLSWLPWKSSANRQPVRGKRQADNSSVVATERGPPPTSSRHRFQYSGDVPFKDGQIGLSNVVPVISDVEVDAAGEQVISHRSHDGSHLR